MLEKTKKVLDKLSHHEFFAQNDVRFVGGTALSYLINHRLSEDLDFAMLKLKTTQIKDMMNKFKAKDIKHTQTDRDYATNDGEDIENFHLKFLLDDVKIEFFAPSFNIIEKEIWENQNTIFYDNSQLKIASFKTIMYMKTKAFWDRKKYRDLFDIYYVLTNKKEFDATTFVDLYLKYNITYDKKTLYEYIKNKNYFYLRAEDEGLSTLVEEPKPYEWYRNKIEQMIYQIYLDELYL